MGGYGRSNAREVHLLAKKSDVTLASEKTGKSTQVIRNFINKHPELGIKRSASGRIVITQEQMDALCKAIEKRDADRANNKARREKAEARRVHMTQEENRLWDEICDYFCYRILEYDKEQSLPKSVCLRLRGMLEGKYMANNSIESRANYSYEVLLNTLKYSIANIHRGFRNNTFNDERHRTNYALKIVEENLNTVYTRMKDVEQSKEKIDKVDTSIITHEGAEYQVEKKKISSRLNDLW